MYKYLVAFVLLSPLAGIALMEMGEFGPSIGLQGYPNGAAAAYALYCAVTVAVALACGRTSAVAQRQDAIATDAFGGYIKLVIFLQLVFLAILLFGFDGIRVWLGQINKSEFRTKAGPFGSVAFLLTKFVIPGLLAYGAVLYRDAAKTRVNRLRWWGAVAIAFICGSTWGYKSTSLFVILPSLLILYWRLSFKQLLGFGGVVMATFAAFFLWFDARVIVGDVTLFEFLLRRLTVIQGDVSWYVWEQYSSGREFPGYAKTLIPFFGDTVFSALTGIQRSQIAVWTEFHFDFLLNAIAGLPLHASLEGTSVTGTPFSEGLIAGGIAGVVVFGAIGGALIGYIYRKMRRALARRQAMTAALLATYFCWVAFPWLNGGAIIQLFHVATVVGMVVTYIAIVLLRDMSRMRLRIPVPAVRAPSGS